MNSRKPSVAAELTPGLPDTRISVRKAFGIDSDMEAPAYSRGRRACAGSRSRLSVRPRHDARDPRRLRLQPPGDDHRLSRHRQVDPHRAGRRAAQLALRAHQPRQPRLAHRSRRQGRDRAQGRQAGHRVPRRHAALGAAEQHRAVLRRIRRGPPGRDVRHPARARGFRPPDAARPAARHPAASGVPPVRDRQHGRPRRHVRPLSRHAADQSGPDGPLVDRRDAQLPAARQGSRHRARQGARTIGRARTAATSSTRWCASPTSPATPSSTAICRR